jgi:hypothetical protein
MADRTHAERQRRYKARKRAEKAGVTPSPIGVTLCAAALMAENEAREQLGDDFERFASAVRDYVLAVDEADHARAVWVAEGRPMRDTFANGMGGVSPFFKATETARTQASRLRAELGLSPASSKRINGSRGAGRPVGAVSAADRKAQAPALKLKAV